VFRFGGEALYQSTGQYLLPAVIAGKSIKVCVDVVNSNIPFLFSMKALKKMDAEIYYGKDTGRLLGQHVDLHVTSSGHHAVNMLPVCESVNAVDLHKLDEKSRYATLVKLHRQFGHPAQDKFVILLKDAGVWNNQYSEAIMKIYSSCTLCPVFARNPARPVVSMPLAREFNEVVAVDLKYWKRGLWLLHQIDMFTRYTMSDFIRRKKPEEVINSIIGGWIGVFGIMRGILSDNGGEFSSDEMRDVGSVLNVILKTTAAESPWQNGLCERNHAVTDHILSKLEAQYPSTPLEVLVKWANMAKNSLQMYNGFSSNQLVFGKNPNLPNIMVDKLPALHGVTQSKALAKHLTALHTAREAFIQSESEERIRRALRHRVRASEQYYNNGDEIYYKKDNMNRWLGPAKVLHQDGKVIFARHGGQLIRLSPNRVTKVKPTSEDAIKDDRLITGENEHSDNGNDVVPVESDVPEVEGNGEADNGVNEVNEQPYTGEVTEDHSAPSDPIETKRSSQRLINKDMGWSVYMVTLPKSMHNSDECMAAKQTELQKLSTFDVYKEVQELGQPTISTRWVLWMKGKEVRARLVARGFEEDVTSCVDSPTVGKSTVRIVLTVAASMKWTVKTTDIKSAFLQGMPLQRDVYLIPPPEAEAEENVLWKLNKCLYGLNDAARRFYDSVVLELLALGCVKSSLDPALFIKKSEGGDVIGILVSHIDDFLHAGDVEFDRSVIDKLCERFLAGSRRETEFCYTGYQISQSGDGILLDQNNYIDNVTVQKLAAGREAQKHDHLNRKELKEYRSMVGSLNWVVQGTRPDLAFNLIELSTKFQNGAVGDCIQAKKVLVKASASKSDIFFPALSYPKNWVIVATSDASHANLNNATDSCMGYLVFVVDEKRHSCPISWKSGKISRVVRSTMAAECLALVEALEDALFIQQVLQQITNLTHPVVGVTDHRGLTEAVRSTKMIDDKRLRIDVASLKELLKQGKVQEIRLCPTSEQLADCLTKRTANSQKLLKVLQTGLFNIQF
jgi:transposase InsO family protein